MLGLIFELNLLTPRLVYVVIGITLDGRFAGLISTICMFRYWYPDGRTIH